jgi:hypothetical protein
MGTAQAQGITGQAQAQAAGDVGQANIYAGALGNLGQLGTQYSYLQSPAIQKALQIGPYAPQTGSTPISGASPTGLPVGGGSSIMVGGSPTYTVA